MRIILVIFVLVLSSCSTLTKSQCESAGWVEIGIVDAKNNRGENFYKNHIDACGTDFFKELDYKKGWEQGLAFKKEQIELQAKSASGESAVSAEVHPELNPVVVSPDSRQLAIENENYKQVKALAIGSVIGLGSGHMIQGTYSERGWIFTLVEGGMLLVPIKSWLLLGFLGVKAYEILDLSKYFYRYQLAYPNITKE